MFNLKWKRYWWPHKYARERGLLWVKVLDADFTMSLPKVTPGEPIHVPDEWVTWEGKEEGKPKPPIIWYGDQTANA